MTIIENLGVAFSAIRMNVLRTILTIFIISFGITSLIGMLTAADGIKGALYSNFASVGSNTFTISHKDLMSEMRRRKGMSRKINPKITYKEASSFASRFNFPAQVSCSFRASEEAVIQYRDIKTAPKTTVMGADQNFLSTSGLELEDGRDFNTQDIEYGRRVVIIGAALKDDLFGNQDASGLTVSLSNDKYIVIGILKKKGTTFGQSQDNMAIIPIIAAQNSFSEENPAYEIAVQVNDINRLEEGIEEATALFRILRHQKLGDENNFVVSKSDSLAEILLQNIMFIKYIAVAVAIITLIGAAVGLTNILLVSVTERTREIGVRKALGATIKEIRAQFLWESLTICYLGGIIGIVAGIGLGNLVAGFLGGSFLMPWGWIILGLAVTFLVGLLAGLGPAARAAKLDPVEALRHE